MEHLGDLKIKPNANSAEAFVVEQADGTKLFKVDASSGALSTTGTLTVTGAASIGGALTQTGNVTLTGTLAITGNETIAVSSGIGLTISGTPSKVFKAGSYSAKIALASGATTEMVTVAGEGAEDDFYIGYGSYMRTTGENGKGFGLATLVEATNTTGTPTVQGGQMMAFLGTVGGTEAAVLKTRGGDATAGLFALWLKIGANTNCVAASGSRMAVLWVDNQSGIQAANNLGEEYGVFATTGGTRPDGFIGFNTSSSGYDNLLYFDSSFNSGAGTCVTTDAVPGTQDARIKVYYNGTQYYLALYR